MFWGKEKSLFILVVHAAANCFIHDADTKVEHFLTS
jgi:hypothetical protein